MAKYESNTLHVAYLILNALEKGKNASPEALNVEEEKWYEVIETLLDEGYIKGVTVKKDIIGNRHVHLEDARITLQGATYLQENSAMVKIAKAIGTGVEIAAKTVIP